MLNNAHMATFYAHMAHFDKVCRKITKERHREGVRKTVSVPAVMSAGTVLAYIEAI